MLSAGLQICFNYKSFQLGADLSSAKFLGGRFAEGRFGKGPICPAPPKYTLSKQFHVG